MQVYGQYEAGRKLGETRGTVVWAARRVGETGEGDCAVKVWSAATLDLLEEGASREAICAQFLADVRGGLDVQAKVSGSPHVAPVLERGEEEGTVWYVTRRYSSTVEKTLRALPRLQPADVAHLLLGITRGALALQQAAGRSHGNLKPTNILLTTEGRLAEAEVAISDPLPGGPDQARACELADLRVIGRILYQLVLRRHTVSEEDWQNLILPLELTPEWTTVFGRNAPRWVELCNRLFAPDRDGKAFDLAQLERELLALRPRGLATKLLIPMAAVGILAVAGVVVVVLAKKGQKGTLELQANVPGVAVMVSGPEGWRQELTLGEADRVRDLKLPPGVYRMDGKFGELEPLRLTNEVTANQVTRAEFKFVFGDLVLLSRPSGAKVTQVDVGEAAVDKEWGVTPVTNRFLPLKKYRFRLRAEGHVPREIEVELSPGAPVTREVELPLGRANEYDVMVSVRPRRALIGRGTNLLEGSYPDRLPVGSHLFTARLEPGFATNVTVNVQPVGPGEEVRTNFTLPFATLNLASTPPGALVFWNETNLVGRTPTNLVWPPGNYAFEMRLDGYKTNTLSTNLADQAVLDWAPALEEMFGPVRAFANLEGTRVRHATKPEMTWTVGPSGRLISLPPGTNQLIAEFTDPQLGLLAPLTNQVTARAGATNEVQFTFEYGTVELNPPPEAEVKADGIILTNRPVRRYQKPDDSIVYTVSAPHSITKSVSLAAAAGQTTTTNVALDPRLYEVVLDVVPPVAQLTNELEGPVLRPGTNLIPWGAGRYRVSASYPRLGQASQDIVLTEQGARTRLALAFAKVSLATKQKGLQVLLDDETTPLGVTPLQDLYLPPGERKFTLRSRSRSESFTTNLVDGQSHELVLPTQFLPESVTNSLGMTLEYVAGVNGYVGQFEVTYGQYTRLVPNAPSISDSGCTGPDCPMVMVSWDQATAFCAALTTQDANHLRTVSELDGSWRYQIPTEAEWAIFAPPDDPAAWTGAVFDEALKAMPVDRNRSSRNRYNLYDTYGNVAELCQGTDGKHLAIGGSYVDPKRPGTTPRLKQGTDSEVDRIFTQGDSGTGFRVILKPAE